MFNMSKYHLLVCSLRSMKLELIEWVSFYSFFTKYSHATRHRHHLTPSFFSVAIHLVQLITSKKERKINIGKATLGYTNLHEMYSNNPEPKTN